MTQNVKISIFGGGNVGSTLAFVLACKNLAQEVVLIDIEEDMAKGKALDIEESTPIFGSQTKLTGTSDVSAIKDSQIVVLTAGIARKPGMSRDDLLNTNASIVKEISHQIKTHAPNSIVIVVTNPLDPMTFVAFKETGFKRNKVIGMGGILDSSRMATFISQKLGNGKYDIQTAVLGGHGDLMVPSISSCSVSNKPLQDFLSPDEIQGVVTRTKNGGAEIVSYLKTGSAYYAPASSIAIMCEAILQDTHKIYPCSVFLEGEYGQSDSVGGVLVSLGANGVEKIVEISMDEETKDLFSKSVSKTKEMIKIIK